MKAHDSEMPRQSFIRRHRWVFNLVWWMGMMIIGFLYFMSPVNIFWSFSLPGFWRFGFWRLSQAIAPFLILQAVVHWFALAHLYPQKRRSNILWAVLFMPFLLFIGIGYAVIVVIAVNGLSHWHD